MSDKAKNVIITFIFLTFIIVFFVVNLLKPESEISISERRKLAKLPTLTTKSLIKGTFTKQFDQYTTDQILYREEFRKLKSLIEFNVFNKKDNNNMYMYEGSIIKIENPLNEKSVLNVANKINKIKEKYLTNCKVYYTIIPDKNYFTNEEEYIRMDYDKLENIMEENIKECEYINIFNDLKLADYYLTDIHWRQENLQKVLDTISTKMGFKNRLQTDYTKVDIVDFEGLYAGQLPIKTDKDTISILSNNIVEAATVYNYETQRESKVYDLTKIDSNDKYDIYLSGAVPLITITNSQSNTDEELIIFRDSFGSSLAPLFIEAYNKITLIDIRYIRTELLENYIEFNEQDVLFMYSTLIINNSSILK